MISLDSIIITQSSSSCGLKVKPLFQNIDPSAHDLVILQPPVRGDPYLLLRYHARHNPCNFPKPTMPNMLIKTTVLSSVILISCSYLITTQSTTVFCEVIFSGWANKRTASLHCCDKTYSNLQIVQEPCTYLGKNLHRIVFYSILM